MISYQSLLLSTIVLNDIYVYTRNSAYVATVHTYEAHSYIHM